MQLNRKIWFAVLCLGLLACTNTSNQPALTDASHPVDHPLLTDVAIRNDATPRTDGAPRTDGSPDAPRCTWSAARNSKGCVPSPAYVQCTATGTFNTSSDPTNCGSNCSGACQQYCAASQFALACASPPADAGDTPADPWYGCSIRLNTSGSVIYCCPC
jgi:hypothetical protein